MKTAFRTVVMTIGLMLITAGNSWASTVVYDKVELFETQKIFTEMFEILEAGSYLATLTDFGFPVPMIETGMDISTATSTLGMLMVPGSFTFNATPGNYYISFYGFADAFSAKLPDTKLGKYGIEISQIPIPSAVWLFASGLLGLITISRRERTA